MRKITLFILFLSAIFNLYGQGKMFPAQNRPVIVNQPAVSNNIVLSQIVYTQSSVYGTNLAATNSGMTNGIFAETKQTGTNSGNEWVMMDLGSPKDSHKELLDSIHQGVHPLIAHTRQAGADITAFYTN